jgi:hypothetical protein
VINNGRLKRGRGSNEQEICPICSEEEDWNHILRCAGTKILRNETVDKRCRDDAEIWDDNRMQISRAIAETI